MILGKYSMNGDVLDIDLRPVGTEHAISALRKYLEVTEAQMEEVHRCERIVLDENRPRGGDEESIQIFLSEKDAVEDLFERDLTPAMRYGFVVLVQTVFETRLRKFCSEIQTERSIPVGLAEINGSQIDRARVYLSKLARLPVADFPEWQHMRRMQKIRDCIVHAYGYVTESRNEREVRELANRDGITIGDFGRLVVTRSICEAYVDHMAGFFARLFQAVGWKP